MILPKPGKYPKTVNVKDEIYRIRVVKRIPKCDASVFGLCDDGDKIIWIRRQQSPRGMFRTFIHELLHAVESEYKLNLNHKRINVLELALEALITDNY